MHSSENTLKIQETKAEGYLDRPQRAGCNVPLYTCLYLLSEVLNSSRFRIVIVVPPIIPGIISTAPYNITKRDIIEGSWHLLARKPCFHWL